SFLIPVRVMMTMGYGGRGRPRSKVQAWLVGGDDGRGQRWETCSVRDGYTRRHTRPPDRACIPPSAPPGGATWRTCPPYPRPLSLLVLGPGRRCLPDR